MLNFSLNAFTTTGLCIIVYEDNARYCAKELVLVPHQTCLEHRHRPRGGNEFGEQETFRCRRRTASLYVDGPRSARDTAEKAPAALYRVA